MKNLAFKLAPIFFLMSMQSQTGFKSYKSNLTQASTAAPVATVLDNDLSLVTLTWARSSTGVYTLTASSAIFTASKTRAKLRTVAGVEAEVIFTSTTVITFKTRDNAGTLADGLLTDCACDIEVWN